MKALFKAIACVLMLSGAAKADSLITWDFSFYSYDQTTLLANGVVSASGRITTDPATTHDVNSYYPGVSIDGTLNGAAMTLIPCFHCGIAATGILFDFTPLEFSAGGVNYLVTDDDNVGILFLESLSSPNPYGTQAIRFSLTQEPVSTPEASTVILLVIGLGATLVFWVRGQKRSMALSAAAN